MFGPLRLWAGVLVRLFHSRQILLIENLALRHQLAVFKRPCRRPRLAMLDKLFWVLLYRFWSSWKKTLIVVSPDTVIRWHRAGFRFYWQLISRVRKPVGGNPVTKEIRELIFKMVAENPTWRAPRIHGELVVLGFEISERSVSRWMRRAPRSPDSAQRWLTFLREAFPYEPAAKFLILDHDSTYGTEVPAAIRATDIKAVRTTVGCPWQNGVAERWVGSCRRELLDHVIAVNEMHLKRLLASYVDYYHADRIHCGLQKQTPKKRRRCVGRGRVIAWPRVGGLHHRYERAA
jgi:putative transposase